MELRTLRSFLAVAHEENISRAAEFLHISQPALSRQLMDLETEFGKKLFIRGKRKVTLTQAGVLLRKRATEIIDLAEKTESDLLESTETISGEVSIGTGETDGILLIGQITKVIKKEYPDIYYDLVSGDGSDVFEKLDRGNLDFGLCLGPVDLNKYNQLPLPFFDTWGVLMRSDAELAEKETIHPEDLWDKPLCLSRQATASGYLESWLKKDIKDLKIYSYHNLISNTATLIEEYGGYAITLNQRMHTAGNRNLSFIPLEPALTYNLSLVWKKYQVFSPAAQKFLETAEELFATEERS